MNALNVFLQVYLVSVNFVQAIASLYAVFSIQDFIANFHITAAANE